MKYLNIQRCLTGISPLALKYYAAGALVVMSIVIGGGIVLSQKSEINGGPTDGKGPIEGLNSGKGAHSHGEVIAGGTDSGYPMVAVIHPKPPSESAQTIEAAGKVLSSNEGDVYALREGVVQSLSVDLGDRVRKGQLLAYLRPDKDQGDLSSDLAFKEQELDIAKQRLTTDAAGRVHVAQAAVMTAEKEQVAELKKVDADIKTVQIEMESNRKLVENAVFDLINAILEAFYERQDILRRYNDINVSDYRRPSIFKSVNPPFEMSLLEFYRKVVRDKELVESNEILNEAMVLGREARLLINNAAESSRFPFEEIDRLKKELDEATDHLLELSSNFLVSESTLSNLEAEKERLNAGTDQRIVELQQEQKGTDLDIQLIEAEIQRIKSQMGASRSITAPFGGVITKRHINVGESVDVDRPLFTIVDDGSMFVRFFITESDLPYIQKEAEVTFAPTFAPSHLHRAIIARIAQSIDPETRTILVEADLHPEDEDGHSLSQMTVRVNVPVNVDGDVLVIPENALTLSEVSNTVWVVDEQALAQPRSVTVRFIQAGAAFIEEGLSPDDWVIAKSPVRLEPSLEVDSQPIP